MKFLKKAYSFIAFLILIAVFNLLCFIVRDDYTTSFYISVGFGNFSLLLCVLTAFVNQFRKEKLLGHSYYLLTGIYELIATILNILFVWFGLENTTVNIVINVIISAIFLCLIFWSLSADADTAIQTKQHREQLDYHYDLSEQAQKLKNKGNSLKLNKKLEAFSDAVENSQIYKGNADVYNKDDQISSQIKFVLELLASKADEGRIINEINLGIEMVEQRDAMIQNLLRRGN